MGNEEELNFLRRDNEELRGFLKAERIENNRFRSVISDLKQAAGEAIGFLRGVRDQSANDAHFSEDVVGEALDAIVTLLKGCDARLLKEASV